ncbi:MAG: hypothetical protein ILO42_04405, partial [Clostridia bacterium]|nr:hypothetical protein [Clostridia bacterium]
IICHAIIGENQNFGYRYSGGRGKHVLSSEKDGFLWYWTLPTGGAESEERQENLFDDDLPF